MNQQQLFQIPKVGSGCVELEKPNFSNPKPQKEEMVKIPVLGTIDSATGRITFYNKNEKI